MYKFIKYTIAILSILFLFIIILTKYLPNYYKIVGVFCSLLPLLNNYKN